MRSFKAPCRDALAVSPRATPSRVSAERNEDRQCHGEFPDFQTPLGAAGCMGRRWWRSLIFQIPLPPIFRIYLVCAFSTRGLSTLITPRNEERRRDRYPSLWDMSESRSGTVGPRRRLILSSCLGGGSVHTDMSWACDHSGTFRMYCGVGTEGTRKQFVLG